MKTFKWLKIGLTSLLTVGIISTCFVVLLWNVDKPTPISTYRLSFNKDKQLSEQEQATIEAKNKFINDIVSETNRIIDKYQAGANNYEGLNFNFANLTSNQAQGEINYFSSLDRTLKDISPDLGIINQQRTPKLINEAFYNKNTEMMSFYWSPDYNDIGTWLKYMFTDTYTMANMWPATYAILKHFKTPNSPELNDIKLRYPWAESLYNFMIQFKIPGTNELLFKSPIEILNYIPSRSNRSKILIDDYYVNIANVIGRWVSDNSALDITEQEVLDPITGQNKIIYYYNQSNPDVVQPLPVGIQFVNWIASQNPNIPYQEVGNNSKTPFVNSIGLYMPTNPNSDINFRDWYYYENEFTDAIAKDWWPSNPFTSNETPWNGPFSKAPNSTYGLSTWTTLTSWSTIGDQNDTTFPEERIRLVANGIMNDISDFEGQDYINLEKEFNAEKTLTFNIRPIPWVDSSGKPTGYYLSPADFYAGFKAFKRSIDNGINANNAYFIGLAAVDFDRTLADINNKALNNSPADKKPFKVYFKDPILSLTNTLDIFQKQYFCALPFKHEKVQNIIDDNLYNNIAKNDEYGKLDTNKTEMTKFYGVGIGYDRNVWGNLWSSGPYYLSDVNQQSITYKINKEYFKSFSDVKNNPHYKSFLLSQNITKDNKTKTVKKIETINIKYAGSYNLDILYEQFKAGELNKALLQSVNLLDAINNQKQYLRYDNVKKINKSNVLGFNLQIYEKWNEPLTDELKKQELLPAQNIIIDENNNPMWDPKTRTVLYSIDEYGNYVWPAGRKPKRKSNVSKTYEDLIVKDFYTPLNEEIQGKSKMIRFTIMNAINWVSLKSLVTPGVSASIQYSFMPYGIYELYNPDRTVKSNYWDLIANKRYLKDEELKLSFNLDIIKQRMSGNMIWTYDELLSSMIKINE